MGRRSPPPAAAGRRPPELPPLCGAPAKAAFVDAASGAALSYEGLRQRTAAAAAALRGLGVCRGDVVLVVSPNSLHFPVVVLGIMSVGAVFSTANFLNTREELQIQIRDSNPVVVVTTSELRPKLLGLVSGPLVLVPELLQLVAQEEAVAAAAAVEGTSPEEAAALMYSSGTTGKSKAVVCTHGNLIDVYLCAVPLFHMFGFSMFVCGALAAGATVVVLRRYSLEGTLAAVAEHRITRLPAVPPMVNQLARSPHLAEKFDLSSLREVICSGAPLAGDHRDRFRRCFPRITLSQCYGLTETSGPITLCDGVAGKVHASIGRLVPSMEAKICDVRTRRPLPPEQIGELCVRGPPATALGIDDEGWLHTGDLCYIDGRGLVFLVDRIKELIKYKAYQVVPAELEEILSRHPDVADVAVIPHPSSEAGEIPVACVVRRDGSSISEDEIISFMAAKVAPYKKIRRVRFVDSIPRSPSGKILRRRLKEATLEGQRLEISPRL
ncbi:unnamed protein product [Spirodela intermedia]|uniref:4-coumarate--CoA ligase n=1 Tax=Spirodela intermedia TaxID=51605 RepID=A0A7I8ICR3_SPIIN|nr:unnamed protein product [Spirodela intermedia]CAA6655411.1 unnamed protein product [Spirodela intermedia]